jgi:hypothetical protein
MYGDARPQPKQATSAPVGVLNPDTLTENTELLPARELRVPFFDKFNLNDE